MEKAKFDYSKLHGRIVEKFGTGSAFIEYIHSIGSTMTLQTLSRKMNNLNFFDQKDIELFCLVLDIAKSEIPAYFFNVKVKNIGHEQEEKENGKRKDLSITS